MSLQPPVPTSHVPDDPPCEAFAHPVAGSLATVVRTYKAAVTRQINRLLQTDHFCVWQGRYHDHIVRSEESLYQIRQYIQTNPARWQEDTFYSDAGSGIPGL
ncbi:MAG: transposase [Chloroflexi bacterium]|nr:transposase [Chloroflexota bacterium]